MTQVKSNISKSSVMKAAWAVFKSTKESFSVCLRNAWRAMKARALMLKHSVHIQYIKADGSLRDAWATLDLNNFQYDSKHSGRKPCYSTVVYFDLGKKAFRSFCIDKFVGVVETK